jgi:hypothetical protein
MPVAAIPEEGLAIEPAIIVGPADGYAIQHDRTVVNGVAAVAFIVTVIGVARPGRIISGSVVICGDAYANTHARCAYANMNPGQPNTHMDLRARRA